jgi:hypothetical protein
MICVARVNRPHPRVFPRLSQRVESVMRVNLWMLHESAFNIITAGLAWPQRTST